MLGSRIGGESDLSAPYNIEFTGGRNVEESRPRFSTPSTKEVWMEIALRQWPRGPQERQRESQETAVRPEKPGAREEPLVTS